MILLFGILRLNSQTENQTNIKVNAASFLLAIPNVGIETSIGKTSTFQVDVLDSFWNSINGLPYKFVILTPEFRYHFNEKFNGFYTGAHIGGSIYKLPVKLAHLLLFDNKQKAYNFERYLKTGSGIAFRNKRLI